MISWEDDFGKLTKKQTELIVGSLLGDGRLECRSLKKTARFRIHHSDSQKNYLFWKYRLLKNLILTEPKRHEYVDRRYKTPVVSWYFHTKTLASLSDLYTLFYVKGRKIVPIKLETMLTPFTVAVWVVDDGCLFKQALILNTQSFTLDEHRFLQGVFKRHFQIEVGIQKDRNNFRLYFPISSTEKILNRLSPFLFMSKFIPVETDSRFNRDEIGSISL